MISKFVNIYRRYGFILLCKKALLAFWRTLVGLTRNLYFRVTPAGTFNFEGKKIKYFRHNYNLAHQNERTVEVAVAYRFLSELPVTARILEVGNVLGNYDCKYKREVLDKYDLSENILNEDVVSFSPIEKYDAIVSISTLEHVGWDEKVRDREKIPAAIRNLRENCLRPDGVMLVTLPFGYNQFFDEYISAGGGLFAEKYFLKRVSADNEWKQVSYSEASDSKFGSPFNNANAVFVGIVRNS